MRLELTTYRLSVSYHNHNIKELTVSGKDRKAFNCLQLWLTASILIQLILLIKQILYKAGKTQITRKLSYWDNFEHVGVGSLYSDVQVEQV